MKCLYDIENVITGRTVYKGLSARDVNKAIGISRNYVYSYALKGLIYNKKYQIHNMGPAPNKNTEFANEWGHTTANLQRYPNVIRNIPIVPIDDKVLIGQRMI